MDQLLVSYLYVMHFAVTLYNNQVPDMSFSQLRSLLVERAKPEYVRLFEQTVTSICEAGFSLLLDFFDRLNEPIERPGWAEYTPLNKTSVVGKKKLPDNTCHEVTYITVVLVCTIREFIIKLSI